MLTKIIIAYAVNKNVVPRNKNLIYNTSNVHARYIGVRI